MPLSPESRPVEAAKGKGLVLLRHRAPRNLAHAAHRGLPLPLSDGVNRPLFISVVCGHEKGVCLLLLHAPHTKHGGAAKCERAAETAAEKAGLPNSR